jgi:hypothetical protein
MEIKNITGGIMIGKITGYAGFRPYGELPYPTMKQGKELVLANKVWESTVRPTDHINPLENYHHNKTVYTKSYLENTYPWHYHRQGVSRTGGWEGKEFGRGTGTAKGDGKDDPHKTTNAGKEGMGDDPLKTQMLKTGTEHWGSIYNNTIGNPRHGLSLTTTRFNNGKGGNYYDGKDGSGKGPADGQ